jgi:vacuolar-type H+-ATPase subunit D/Vma8
VLERKRDILLRELRASVFDAEKTREDLLESSYDGLSELKEANMAKGSEAIANTRLNQQPPSRIPD